MAGISGHDTIVVGSVAGAIGNLTGLSIPGIEVTTLETSVMGAANSWKTFIAGMKDAGEVTLDLLFLASEADTLHDNVGLPNEDWTVTFADGSIFTCSGFIQKVGEENPMDGLIAQSATIKLSGAVAFTPAS